MTGSMIIPNSLGATSLLVLTEGKATAPGDISAALRDARACLKREKGNASGREGNVKFLEAWIKLAENPEKSAVSNVSSSIPSKNISLRKTPEQILKEAIEKSNAMKKEGQKTHAST